MDTTMSEVVQFIQENDVKFIRLAFCDIFGNQKNIAIQPTELTRAFEYGIHFNASALRGFLNVDASDLLLFPDPATLSVLPWRPAQGRVVRFYCDIRYPDGTPFEGDGRYLLRQASRRARKAGYSLTMCTASEFYLFELDENGHPTTIPHDHGEYFDVAPLDKAENVRRQICLTLEEMNIQPESSHHEQGPGQNEGDFRAAEALEAADNFVTFKWVVKSMASSSGLYASFLPKPLQNTPGSGLHLAVSITKDGQNLFHPSIEESEEGRQFVAGVLRRAAEMTIFGNPLTNSFQRLGEFEAPKYITWSHQNRAPLITVPLATGGKPNRFKLRSSVFGIPYLVSLAVGAVVVISYTFAGGFFAVCWTDFFQGLMMFFCVVAVPLIAVFRMGGPAEFISSVEAFNPNFLSMFVDGATNTPYTAMGIVSLVAWGLGYFGQPHILVRFMGISSPAAIKKSRRIATVWVVISLTAAVMIGVSGRMVLGDGLLDGNGQQEIIYITMVSKFFPLFIAGIFLSAILAAIMSTADSQLLVTASALTKDFYHNKIRPQATEKELMWVSRGCVMGVAVIAVLIATNQNSTVLGLVSYAWGGFGSAFGPLVLCSLFWKRTNKQGAYAGILVGGIVDLVWAQLSGGIFDLYEIVPGFVCGLIAIFVVSLLTAAPSKEITDEFDSYRSCEE